MRHTCPVCDRPTEARFRPFCSHRCADVDLGRWLAEGYRIPVSDDETVRLDQPDEPG